MKTVTTLGQLNKGFKVKNKSKLVSVPTAADYASLNVDMKAEMINALIPIGLMMVHELIEDEIRQLIGKRYSRDSRETGQVRYGSNPGSVTLSGQRLGIQVPRVRNLSTNKEVKLQSVEALKHQGLQHNETLFKRVLLGISCRDYATAADALPEAMGLSSSTISRKFKVSSEKHFNELMTRDLSKEDFIALVLDGKSCAKEMILIAVGVTASGHKIPLGIAQIGNENERVVLEFLKTLIARGFTTKEGVLAVIDGSKGLNAGVKKAFANEVIIQRCQWHKRENVVSHLPKGEQALWRKRLQNAYQKPTYEGAKEALKKIGKELSLRNQTALNSLEEGIEETLTLHRLGVFEPLGFSLKTTNILESINSLIEKRVCKISYYKNSSQRLRWYASALLDVESRLHRINGFEQLPKLRDALKKELKLENKFAEAA